MPGPPKKPSALKKAQGTYRTDRAPLNEPQPPRAIPPRPPHLSAAARREWDRVAPILLQCGILRESDLAILMLYVDAFGRYVSLKKAVVALGRVQAKAADTRAGGPEAQALAKALHEVWGEVERYPSGVMQIRQLAAARDRAAHDLYRYALELGLSAPSRTKIEADSGPEKPKGRLFNFINGGKVAESDAADPPAGAALGDPLIS